MASDADHDSELGSQISDWEIEEGLPQFEDQFIQQYLQGREALIDQEKSQRSDYMFRQSLNPMASEACTIVSRILAEERRTFWAGNPEQNSTSENALNPYPGMMFTLAQDTIRKTKSWNIVKKMPKGALLHAHQDAMINVEWLIDQVLATDGMVILTQGSGLFNAQQRAKEKLTLKYTKRSLANVASIWTEDYPSCQPVAVRKAAASFPDGGIEGFKVWLKSRCTITLRESIEHHLGVDDIWQKFTSCFPTLNSMENYEPIFRASMQRILHEFSEDGLRWVDFRCMFYAKFTLEGSEEPTEDFSHFLRIFDEEVKKFQASNEGKDFWGCRIIWSSLRSWGKRQIVEHMKECIRMKIAYPDIIAGYDLVGQEDMGRPLSDLTPELFWFKKRCVESGVDLPFFFHAGECLGDGDDTDQNLFDAVLLGTRRIGHGFSLFKHPLLMDMVKTKKILVESCPISNEVLRLTSSIKAHTVPALLARGVPCALSNDDPAVLGHRDNGVSQDFWQALQGWENLGLAGLGSLAENSVRWAAFEDQTAKVWNKDIKDGVYGEGIRGSRLREWTAEWNKFCEWIVMEYAVEYGGDM